MSGQMVSILFLPFGAECVKKHKPLSRSVVSLRVCAMSRQFNLYFCCRKRGYMGRSSSPSSSHEVNPISFAFSLLNAKYVALPSVHISPFEFSSVTSIVTRLRSLFGYVRPQRDLRFCCHYRLLVSYFEMSGHSACLQFSENHPSGYFVNERAQYAPCMVSIHP